MHAAYVLSNRTSGETADMKKLLTFTTVEQWYVEGPFDLKNNLV